MLVRPLIRRPSQVVAEEIHAMILHGEINGAQEPLQEQELAAQLGVSRHHLREALRILELEGVVRVQPGRNGGVYLTEPGAEALMRTFGVILAHSNTSLRDLIAARLAIEPAAAAAAALEAADEDYTLLDEILREQAATPYYSEELNLRFHTALAAASHNQALLLMMHALEGVFHNLIDSSPDLALRDGSYRAHVAIVRALRARDAVRVADYVRRHIAGYEERLRLIGLDPAAHTVADMLRAVNVRRR